MIGFLKGTIQSISEDTLLILTNSGVGYDVYINERTYTKLIGSSDTSLYIYHHISESSQNLFGFISREEKKVFTELIKISGVGGKVAQNILSLGTEKLSQALALEDNNTIESIKGIGKKMASKIILELKDKDFIMHAQPANGDQLNASEQLSPLIKSQIIDTLSNMGYNKNQVLSSLSQLPEGIDSVDEIIPFVIKNI